MIIVKSKILAYTTTQIFIFTLKIVLLEPIKTTINNRYLEFKLQISEKKNMQVTEYPSALEILQKLIS